MPLQTTRNIIDALFTEHVYERGKNLGKAVVQKAIQDLIESLDEDDTIMDTWDELTVLQRIIYIAGEIIERIANDVDDDFPDDFDEEDYEEDYDEEGF